MPSKYRQAEYWEQVSLFSWLASHFDSHEILKWTYHTPNGGSRSAAEGARMKRSGVKRGVWDVFNFHGVEYAGKYYQGIWIEFKSGKNPLSEEQREFKVAVEQAGYYTAVAYNWVEAAVKLLDFYGIEHPNDLRAAIKFPRG